MSIGREPGSVTLSSVSFSLCGMSPEDEEPVENPPLRVWALLYRGEAQCFEYLAENLQHKEPIKRMWEVPSDFSTAHAVRKAGGLRSFLEGKALFRSVLLWGKRVVKVFDACWDNLGEREVLDRMLSVWTIHCE